MIAVAGLLLALVLVYIYTRRNAGTRNCRWREDRAGSRDTLMRYTCITCGAEAYRATGKPDRCLAGLNKPGL